MTLLLAVLLAVASVAYAFFALRFATSARAMLPPDAPYIQRYVEYGREFGDLDDVVIVVEATSLPEATVYAGQLVRELKKLRADVVKIIDGQLARVKGIDRIETYVALDIRKYESWFGNLAHL